MEVSGSDVLSGSGVPVLELSVEAVELSWALVIPTKYKAIPM